MPTKFPLKLSLRIDWSEMDQYGHVNNVAYFKYIQSARVNYWETIGLARLFKEEKKGPILASTSCDFRKALHYPGNITLRSGISQMRETSFEIQHRIFNEAGEIAAEARDIVVFYDFNTDRKLAITPEMRALVDKMEACCD